MRPPVVPATRVRVVAATVRRYGIPYAVRPPPRARPRPGARR
ncbi:MAG TPA: hypothetical protein PKC73_04445 [Dermatophilaceae bacterium]|nr:hypothetical protein [Dermatophilaceae bacterium]